MTVNETLIVCKILKENGYGNYKLYPKGYEKCKVVNK